MCVLSICCKNLHVGACVAALLSNEAIFYESEEKVSQRLSFFLKNERALCTPRSSVPREETQTHNTQPKFCFYDHNTTARQFPDKTNRTSKGNVLGSSTKSCESAGERIIRGSATATQQKPRIRQSNIHSGAKGHNPARKVVTRFFEDSIEMGTRDRVAVRARSHVCWTMGCTAGWGAHWVIV